MLRTDEGVVEITGFLLGISQDSAGSICESFEHNSPFALSTANRDSRSKGHLESETQRDWFPPSLAYGAAGQSGIPPNDTLVFIVDLLKTAVDSCRFR